MYERVASRLIGNLHIVVFRYNILKNYDVIVVDREKDETILARTLNHPPSQKEIQSLIELVQTKNKINHSFSS